MNCRHDVPAYLGRRGLGYQPSCNCWWGGDPRTESGERTYCSKREVIGRWHIPQGFQQQQQQQQQQKRQKTLRLIHTVGFSERSREKGGLEDWTVPMDVMSHSWRNISVMGVWRVWNYSCCNFSEYIFGVSRCTIKYLCLLWRPVWEERCVCALSEDIRYMHPQLQSDCMLYFFVLSLPCIAHGPLHS